MELGGPEVGRGCGGRGIIHGFELLEKLGFHEWDFDYVLLDFLGDVVERERFAVFAVENAKVVP